MAFIYCDHKKYLSQTVEYFIGVIVRQLLERRKDIPPKVRTLYDNYHGKDRTPTCEEYLDVLRDLGKEYAEIYIVVDALDECIDRSGQAIWADLLSKLEASANNLRLLYTSRNIEDASGILGRSARIDVRASEKDIENFVLAQLQSQQHLLRFCRQCSTLQDEILQAIVPKSGGMSVHLRL